MGERALRTQIMPTARSCARDQRVDQRVEHRGAHVGRAPVAQRLAAPSPGGAQGFDDVRMGHEFLP